MPDRDGLLTPSRLGVGALVAIALATGCALPGRRPAPTAPEFPRLSAAAVTALIPAKVPDRDAWARDVLAALDAYALGAAAPTVCQVLAVIEQESGFRANPVVPDLARIVREELDRKASRLGPLGRKALDELLDEKGPGQKLTFRQRLDRVKTERDVDVVFRDLLAFYEERYPKTYWVGDTLSGLFGGGNFEELNPITTAGSMQVSVRFATALGAKEGLGEREVRDALYTRAGGVRFGTARLLGHAAAYPVPLYRFADFNAGVYASRNAALQEQVARLTGRTLALDGDLLLYDRRGEPRTADSKSLQALLAFRERYAPELSEGDVRRDARAEKALDLESTALWRAVKRAYELATGQPPAYARLPDVALHSPKLSRERSTAWFAKAVDARYRRCLERSQAAAPSYERSATSTSEGRP